LRSSSADSHRAPHRDSAPPGRLTRWHVLTVSLLFLDYGGFYFCRSDYSAALPLIIAEQVRKGTPANVAQIRLGTIASLGVLVYAICKFPSGGLFLSGNGIAHLVVTYGWQTIFLVLARVAGLTSVVGGLALWQQHRRVIAMGLLRPAEGQ
jgi:sugar phosphate permease